MDVERKQAKEEEEAPAEAPDLESIEVEKKGKAEEAAAEESGEASAAKEQEKQES